MEPHLAGMHLDGAAMLRSDGTPAIVLSLRYDHLDNFWFTLSHELAHISLRLGKELCACVDDFESDSIDLVETAADQMAQDALIPATEWLDIQSHQCAPEPKGRDFARRLRIHPAIVTGKLRRERSAYRILAGTVGQRKVRGPFST